MKTQSASIIKFALLALVWLSLIGCSSKELYESTQPKYDENECRKLPPYQYDECINQEAKTYEEYKKEREEIIDKKG
jgi:hypothetical protein